MSEPHHGALVLMQRAKILSEFHAMNMKCPKFIDKRLNLGHSMSYSRGN